MAASRPWGVYVHVPFCARTCDFCAFYQVRPDRAAVLRYLEGIEHELALRPRPAAGVATVFWGGGTPGLLPPGDLERLGQALLAWARPADPIAPFAEWTVELAPGSVRPERLRVLRALGVNRVSLGVQSFAPRVLEALGRPHTPAQVRQAWDWMGAAGFRSCNLDLIAAVPGQTAAEWEADLREALALGPDHLSAYTLTLEEDTALYLRLQRGQVRPDVEREALLFERTHEVLGAAGWEHYEVSNFARPGHACRHNLHTWRMGCWAGFGPAAASQEEDARGANPADLDAWRADLASGRRATADRVVLDARARVVDRLIFGLRTAEGVAWAELAGALEPEAGAWLHGWAEALREAGVLAADPLRLRPTLSGFLLADRLGAELLEALAPGPAPVSG